MTRHAQGKHGATPDPFRGWRGRGSAEASAQGQVGKTLRNGRPVRGVPLGDLTGIAQKRVAVEAMLDVECWCHKTVVRVYEQQIVLGRTASCGSVICFPPPGFVEAERKCCDCDEWFTPKQPSARRCVACNVVKHFG